MRRFFARSVLGWKRLFHRCCGNRVPAVEEWFLVGQVGTRFPRTAAFVTLVTGPAYVRGARVLGVSLKMHNVRDYPLIALGVGLSSREQQALQDVGWEVRMVEPIPFFPPGRDKQTWKWIPEARLGPVHVQALTKMRVWEMDEFERVIFIDSDAWVVGDVCAHLCRREEDLVAMYRKSVDVNSGVMSLKPSVERFRELMSFWENEPSKFFHYPKKYGVPEELSNPDQSLILGFYEDRKLPIGPLSTRYNLNCRIPSDSYSRILHFNIDKVKPWNFSLKEAMDLASQSRDDQAVWRYVVQWLQLESKVNITFPARP